jgi:hypothetical protein
VDAENARRKDVGIDSPASMGVTGCTTLEATLLNTTAKMAKSCPVLESGRDILTARLTS